MKSNPDNLLNQLVVAALTVFTVLLLLLAALVLRQVWLQQRIADLSSDMQANLEDLEEIAAEIQRELVEIRMTPGTVQNVDSLEVIADVLDDVAQQLDSIGEDLNEVALVLEPQTEATSVLTEEDEPVSAGRGQVDQVFTVFAVLVGVAGIVIAILLGMVLRIQGDMRDWPQLGDH